MPNQRYLAGRRLEYQVRNFFKSAGLSVIRASGSHGEWDIVAIDETTRTIYLVQCKRGKKMQVWNGGFYKVRKMVIGNIKQLHDLDSGSDSISDSNNGGEKKK
jgi:Holliday junction resolvase